MSLCQVICEFRDDMAVTVVGHSALGRLPVMQRGQYSVTHSVTYSESATVSQLLGLVDNSAFCFQELTYVMLLYVGRIHCFSAGIGFQSIYICAVLV